jgi:hypothetical protein
MIEKFEFYNNLLDLIESDEDDIYNDLKTIEATFSGSDIDFEITLLKRIQHPFEAEVTLKTGSKYKKINIS